MRREGGDPHLTHLVDGGDGHDALQDTILARGCPRWRQFFRMHVVVAVAGAVVGVRVRRRGGR